MPVVLEAVLPVFIAAAVGFAIRKRVSIDVKTLSVLNIYVFIPSLVFANLSRQPITWELFGKIAVGAAAITGLLTIAHTAVARLRHMTPAMTSAFMLTMFPNLGNFGLPVCKFAFGDSGLAIAVVVMVCGSFLQNSLGVFFAVRSRHGRSNSLLQVLAFPMVYAFVAALLVQRSGVPVPDILIRPIDLLADAAIPVQLVLLGAKVAETRLFMNTNMALACSLRLIVSPLIAIILTHFIGLENLAASVFIVQMSGPIAVGMAVYGVQFDVEPGFLASAVSWSFLFSLLTVSVILFILMRV
ncbi:MAG: hypothetical protein AMXMBFR84_24590 [Candidatus Hydrogenedentota bacterium]